MHQTGRLPSIQKQGPVFLDGYISHTGPLSVSLSLSFSLSLSLSHCWAVPVVYQGASPTSRCLGSLYLRAGRADQQGGHTSNNQNLLYCSRERPCEVVGPRSRFVGLMGCLGVGSGYVIKPGSRANIVCLFFGGYIHRFWATGSVLLLRWDFRPLVVFSGKLIHSMACQEQDVADIAVHPGASLLASTGMYRSAYQSLSRIATYLPNLSRKIVGCLHMSLSNFLFKLCDDGWFGAPPLAPMSLFALVGGHRARVCLSPALGPLQAMPRGGHCGTPWILFGVIQGIHGHGGLPHSCTPAKGTRRGSACDGTARSRCLRRAAQTRPSKCCACDDLEPTFFYCCFEMIFLRISNADPSPIVLLFIKILNQMPRTFVIIRWTTFASLYLISAFFMPNLPIFCAFG